MYSVDESSQRDQEKYGLLALSRSLISEGALPRRGSEGELVSGVLLAAWSSPDDPGACAASSAL